MIYELFQEHKTKTTQHLIDNPLLLTGGIRQSRESQDSAQRRNVAHDQVKAP